MALRMVLGLVAVSAIAVLVLRRAARRVGVLGRGGVLEAVDRLPLDGGRTLLVVRAGAHYLLVADGPDGVCVLRELDAEVVEASLAEGDGDGASEERPWWKAVWTP